MCMRNASLYVRKIFVIVFLLVFQVSCSVQDPLNDIEVMLSLSEKDIDIATAKLTIDKIIDPSVDVDKYLKKIDDMVSEIIKISTNKQGDFKHIKTVLYKEGPWNNYQIYSYNYDDPYGKDLINHTLSNYLNTKKGNCVSMPVLFYILTQKLGFETYISNAPRHLFVQVAYGDEFLGLEATRNGKSWMMKDFITQWEISETAKANRIYYERLSKKEVIAELLNQAIIHYMRTKQYKKALRAADLALKYYPKGCIFMLNKAAVYAILLDDQIYLKGIIENAKNKEEYYHELELRYHYLHNVVEHLGYKKFTKEDWDDVLERIRKIKEGIENV